jgi:hypothetical protein
MTKITSLLVTLLSLGLGLVPAEAQLARTYVSAASGNDGNDCNRLTPCRTFQKAHDSTLAAGEITVLDPGGYGALTITKAISIINDGVGEAGVLVSGGLNGITVTAGPNDAVSLRGITVKGIGFGGGNGIVFNAGGSLIVENCAIRTLDGSSTGVGILFQPLASSHLAVLDTIVADNTASGIAVLPRGSGSVAASLSSVQLINNGRVGFGIQSGIGGSTATINAVVEDAIAAKNGTIGFYASTTGTPAASLMVIRSVTAHNQTGIVAETNATLRIGQSTVAANTVGWVTNFGVLQSYGDNYINGNSNGDPPIPTIIVKK